MTAVAPHCAKGHCMAGVFPFVPDDKGGVPALDELRDLARCLWGGVVADHAEGDVREQDAAFQGLYGKRSPPDSLGHTSSTGDMRTVGRERRCREIRLLCSYHRVG